ncbi:helix-turn-helix domain-containing protein [Enterococcus devriesei]
MTINLMEFLDESARYRLNILQIFDLRKGQFISSDLLIEFLGISKFKLNNYLTELEKDLGETEDTRLHRLARGEIEIVHLTNEVIRQLRLKYVKASETFIFFQELVLYGTSAEKFAQKNFLSRSKAYLIKNNLGKIVRSAGVKVGDSELRGDETAVRNLLFEVYYYFFNGIESPFPQELQTEIRSYIELIRSVFHIERILTRLIKLELFLGIVLIRWK